MYLTATQYHQDEPCHLIVTNIQIKAKVTIIKYTAPVNTVIVLQKFMHLLKKKDNPTLKINASNCIFIARPAI